MTCGMPLAVHAQDAVPRPAIISQNLSSQALMARDYMLEQGQKNFFILDKINASIIVFEDGDESFRTPVFLGRAKSDNIDSHIDATPAGTFKIDVWEVKGASAMERAGTVMPFMCQIEGGVRACYALHPSLESAVEKAAMKTDDPDQRALSNGCVRVPLRAYEKLEDFVRRHEAKGQSPRFVVLPYDKQKTQSYFRNPQEFAAFIKN